MSRIFLVLSILLFALTTNAQKADTAKTVGNLFIDASRNYKTGFFLEVGGAGVIIITPIIARNLKIDADEVDNISLLGAVIGGGMILAGIGHQYTAWMRIGEAGRLINNKGITLHPTKEGIGLSYKF